MRKALKRHISPDAITTDGLRTYGAAMDELGCRDRQEICPWGNRHNFDEDLTALEDPGGLFAPSPV